MDLIFKSDPRVKPLVRLGLALSAFEGSLTDGRRAAFEAYRDQARCSQPDLEAVRMITAEIDCQSGRPLGTRFNKILDATQRVIPLIDVMVGGSQNLIACGIWASLRLTLVTLSAMSSYRENASKLFMEIGRSAPRHDALTTLYPNSKRLQDAVWEYFIIVVQLCMHLLQSSAQNRVRALVVAVFADHTLKNMKHDLGQWAQMIDREVTHLLSETVSKGHHPKSKSLCRVTLGSGMKEKKRTSGIRLEWLNACSEYQHEPAWVKLRKQGNATFFLQEPSYRMFKGRKSSCTLLCNGRLGAGKSVLMANMVDDLVLSNHRREYTTAYFFVQPNDVRSITARAILGSLSRQILASIQDEAWVNDLPDMPDDLSLDGVVALLRQVLPAAQRIYVILDGLDECEADEKILLLGYLKELQTFLRIHLCVSLRLEANRGKWKEYDRLDPDILLAIPENNPDIAEFVKFELRSLLDSGELAVSDAGLVREIEDRLITGSKGMFLWVSLQLQTICHKYGTDRDIRRALQSLPQSLPDVYKRILSRCKKTGERYQLRILKLLTAAFRPLSAEDLRQCLSIVPGEISWALDNMINDIFATLSCCGGLVVIDEEELTIHLVHPSVRQFLLGQMCDGKESRNNSSPPSEWQFSADDAHREMLGILVTYMHSFETRGTVVPHRDPEPEASLLPNPQAVIKFTKSAAPTGSSKAVVQIVSKLSRLKQTSKPQALAAVDVSNVAEDLQRRPPGVEDEFTFLPYAKEYWLLHSTSISKEDARVYNLWEALTDMADYANCFQWSNLVQRLKLVRPSIGIDQVRGLRGHAPDMMVWAIITSNHALLDARLAKYTAKLQVLRNCCSSVVWMNPLPVIDGTMAARLISASILAGFHEPGFLRWLLSNRPDLSYGKYGCIYTALLASRPGLARILLRTIPDGQPALGSCDLPLLAEAVEVGDPRTVRMLIRRGARIDIRRDGVSVLELAVVRFNQAWHAQVRVTGVPSTDGARPQRRLMVVYLLLRHAVAVNAVPKDIKKRSLIPAAKLFVQLTNCAFFNVPVHMNLNRSDLEDSELRTAFTVRTATDDRLGS
ncbi:hypothetical protein QBC47DRAFT_434211 [Echria macrotheca]|uniref:NACHT domain-containing protein n=1 Tax=Echria macrotheca TaxID=438768 RepID=A0AAJ0B423_9PEZI|nr:hypothetical protein QBC47DRAFT_434211 [Echria macrotheca]